MGISPAIAAPPGSHSALHSDELVFSVALLSGLPGPLTLSTEDNNYESQWFEIEYTSMRMSEKLQKDMQRSESDVRSSDVKQKATK